MKSKSRTQQRRTQLHFIRDGEQQHLPRHGGSLAKMWRSKLARLAAKKPGTITKTIKCKLEMGGDELDFGAASKLYNAIEGTQSGSLLYYLCMLHLAGFRLFANKDAASKFVSRQAYPTKAFHHALVEHLGIDCPGLSPAKLDLFIHNKPKGKEGVLPAFDVPILTARLYLHCTGKRQDDKADDAIKQCCQAMAESLCNRFADWQAMVGNRSAALEALDSCFQQLSPAFPSLTEVIKKEGAYQRAKAAPIAFDRLAAHGSADCPSDLVLHQVVAQCLSQLDTSPSNKKLGSELKAWVCDRNTLSWLFGVGLKYFCDTPIAQIRTDFAVPQAAEAALERMIEAAKALPVPLPFWSLAHYARCRTKPYGKIGGWLTSYIKRLEELYSIYTQGIKPTIPQALYQDKAASLFSGVDIDSQWLKQLPDTLDGVYKEGEAALKVLRGQAAGSVEQAVAAAEQSAATLCDITGQLKQIENQRSQAEESAKERKDAEAQKFWTKCKLTIPQELTKPPGLNRISGGVPDIAADMTLLGDTFNNTIAAHRQHRQQLLELLQPGSEFNQQVLLASLAQMHKDGLSTGRQPDEGFDKYAWRSYLDRIGKLARKCSPSTRDLVIQKFAQAGVFAAKNLPPKQVKRHLNQYFINQRGALFRSVYSTSAHSPYAIHLENAQEIDWLGFVQELADQCYDSILAKDTINPALLRDWQELERLLGNWLCQVLPPQVPGKFARPRLKQEELNVPPYLLLRLKEEKVPRKLVARLLNLYISQISGLGFRLARSSFMLRTSFRIVDDNALVYVPKPKAWYPPQQYLRSNLRQVLQENWVVRKQDGAICPPATLEAVGRTPTLGSATTNDKTVRRFLAQLPHDWCYALPAPSAMDDKKTGGIQLSKGKLKSYRQHSRLKRLIGPPSHKTAINNTLTFPEVTWGDLLLIVEQTYHQHLRVENKKVHLEAKPVSGSQGQNVAIAVSLEDKRQPEPLRNWFTHCIGFDQGEYGLGYAVFALEDAWQAFRQGGKQALDTLQPVAQGHVTVPSIRRLMRKVKHHRSIAQPGQKLQQSFSRALEAYRKHVIADVCQRIDRLCAQYRAFPVLEGQVKNFETGSNQLRLVYGSVLHRYIFSDIDAHKEQRREYWFGADEWKIDWLLKYGYENKYLKTPKGKRTARRSDKVKPLSLYPGVSINAAHTSQQCVKCGINPLLLLREKKDMKLQVEEGGYLRLDNIRLQLQRFAKSSDYEGDQGRQRQAKEQATRRALRQKNKRLILRVPLEAGSYDSKKLERFVRSSMRRPNPCLLSRDTTQSQYHCVNTACGAIYHADEGAAINIARMRFLCEKIAWDKIPVDGACKPANPG